VTRRDTTCDTRPRTRAAAATLVLAFAIAACHRAEPAAAETRLLVIDGMTIPLAEAEPYLEFLDTFVPEFAPKTKLERVLDEHLIPLYLARREFAAERAVERQRAIDLRSVATNAYELEQASKNLPTLLRSKAPRLKLKLPVARYLFDTSQVGGVSEPIELPHGYVLAATFDMNQSALALDDHVDCLQVGFFTQPSVDFLKWYEGQKPRLGDRVTFIHPDHRAAMPAWIRPPKQSP
jgi:hypothetical protein